MENTEKITAPQNTLPAMKTASGWMSFLFTLTRQEDLSTSINIDEEIWLSLHHISEVQELGYELIKRKCTLTDSALHSKWEEFRGYIRQAENFYRGALPLDYKSSPLNYYYSFLNLVKAYLLLNDNLLHKGLDQKKIIRHGLSPTRNYSTKQIFLNNSVDVAGGNEVFSKFYKAIFDRDLQDGFKFLISELVGYVYEISWQVQRSGSNYKLKSFHGHRALLFDRNRTEAWEFFDIDGRILKVWDFRKETIFKSVYKQVDPNKGFMREMFDMDAEQVNRGIFFESIHNIKIDSITTYHDLNLNFKKALYDSVSPVLVPMGYSYDLCAPYSTSPFVSMNQELAIYITMYFLSDLVRYNPHVIDWISETKDSWILESFVKSAPLMFLRAMNSRLIGSDILLRRL